MVLAGGPGGWGCKGWECRREWPVPRTLQGDAGSGAGGGSTASTLLHLLCHHPFLRDLTRVWSGAPKVRRARALEQILQGQ